ncbi:MAG: SEC59/DGK1/VTE5 family protein [DPANN group archaeon]|nr:SEC59/DGK1/VTE5 family protein [DPANN group archaeon]
MAEMSLKKEFFRKLIHLTSLLIVVFYYYLGKEVTLFILVFALILFIESEYLRVEKGITIPLLHDYVRDKEQNRLAGHIFFIMGAIISISVFDMDIAVAAILMTTFGDSAATIIGRRYGKVSIPGIRNKKVEGCFAELFVNLIIGYLFIDSVIIILLMAFTATIVETLVDELDDNLIIPVFAGFYGQAIRFMLKFFGN